MAEQLDAGAAALDAIIRAPFGERIGLRARAFERDRVVVALPFSKENTTLGETVHGGAIASLVDAAATAAAWSGIAAQAGHRGTTIGFSISYLASAPGRDLLAEARVRRRGRSICFVDVTVRDPDGNDVAFAQVTYKLEGIAARGDQSPAEVMAGLFTGKSPEEQRALLATLERSGAALYRAWASAEASETARRALAEAAQREVENAELLEAKLG